MVGGLGQQAEQGDQSRTLDKRRTLRSRGEYWNQELSACLLKSTEDQINTHRVYLKLASDAEVRWLVNRYGEVFTRGHILSVLGSLYLKNEEYLASEAAFGRLLRMRHNPFPNSKTRYLQLLASEGRRQLWLWQMEDFELERIAQKLIATIEDELVDEWTPHIQYKIAVCFFRLGRHETFFEYAVPLFSEDSIKESAFMAHAPRFRESCYLLMVCALLEAGFPREAGEWLDRIRICSPLSEYFNTGSRLMETWGK